MSDFEYLRGRTVFFSYIVLVASCLTFPMPQISLDRSPRTPDIVKNLRRAQRVTVQKWTVTVGE
jgi:hypothetical protein